MGGVAGIRAWSDGAIVTAELRRMADLLHHRGPEGSGVWIGRDVGLAHTLIARHGEAHPQQPMHSVDGRWAVALDGRVTNHDSLRAHLDPSLRTRTDVEVVLAGLTLDGISFVERLHGEFALVAHDLRTDTTHLVRDRLGIRPLYYRHIPGGLVFGSEVKALLAVGPPPQVDHRSLDSYLDDRFVAAPDTLFEGVKKVRPAHRLSIMSGGHLEETYHWALPEMDPEGTWSADDAVEAISDGVREAVRSALDADDVGGDVGVHLSGGLDSSLVAAQVRQLRGEGTVHTFTAGFDGPHRHDALPWARRVSTLLGTEHHEVRLGAVEFEDLWARLTWYRDAPLSDPDDVIAHALGRAAREHVQVSLSGEGGSALFGATPPRWRAALPRPVERRLVASHGFTPTERVRLLGAAAPPERRTPVTSGADLADRSLRHGLRHRLPDDVLERWDRMSAAASLELRLPLLDQRLVELAFRLPSSVKVRSGTTRWVLKEAARLLLPDEVIERRDGGPGVPLDWWLRDGLRDTARERLTGSGSWVAQNMDRSLVSTLLDRRGHGRGQESRLWTLLCLEMWHESFFGSSPRVPRTRADSAADAPATTGPSGS